MTPWMPDIASRMSIRRMGGVLGISENAQCFRLDSQSKQWVQACTRHYVGFRAQDAIHPFLDIHQVDEAEARIVRIEKISTSLPSRASARATEPNK